MCGYFVKSLLALLVTTFVWGVLIAPWLAGLIASKK